MSVFAIRLQHKRKISLLVICLAMVCALSCHETMPPMSEYQFVTAIPIDDVERGMLFVVDNSLYVLHHTSDRYHLDIIERYNVSNPYEPTFDNATYLSMPIHALSRVATHRHHAFFYDYQQLIGMDFNTLTSHSRLVDFQVYDLACNAQYLFLNTDSGLRIWDIANWPEYTEVYYDSMTRYNGQTATYDTVLFEIYRRESEYKYSFWDIKNVNEPFVISEGSWFHDIHDIAMNSNYIIYSTGHTLYRYTYDSCDTLILEESADIGEIYEHILSDSLIYLRHSSDFTAVALNDFDDYVMTSLLTGLNNPNALALAVYKDVVFILAYKSGILVFERREL